MCGVEIYAFTLNPPPSAAEAAELANAIALSHELDAASEVTRARARLAAHPEPPEGAPRGSATQLRITLPSGAKLGRRFAPADTLATVRDWVFATSHELGTPLRSPAAFDLACSMPRRTFAGGGGGGSGRSGSGPGPEDGLDLQAAGLHPQAVLFVTERS